jgi:hypothetical protein
MPAPVPYKKLLKELREAGCTVDETKYPHIVAVFCNGELVGTLSVTHGGNTKGNEVKFPYVRAIRKALERIRK